MSTSPLAQYTASSCQDAISRFIGGRGFNVGYLYEHLPADIDPLGSENILLISAGLLTGTSAPASSRVHVSSLSPQTGLIGSSNVGGQFGARMHGFGIQTLVIQGCAESPGLFVHS